MGYVKKLLCPECKTPYDSDDYQCTECELILNLDLDRTATSAEPNVVQAFLSPPRRTAERPAPPSVGKRSDPDVTAPGAVSIDKDMIPKLIAGPDLGMRPLHPFEAYVASFINGVNSALQVAEAAEISAVEAMAVLGSLAQRKVIELKRLEPTQLSTPPALEKEPHTEPSEADTLPPERRTPSRGRPLPDRPPPQWVTASNQFKAMTGADGSALQHAVSLELRGDVQGALGVLKRAFTQVKHRPAALFNKLALVVINQLKDVEQAEELLRKATELEPENQVYQQNLVTVLKRLPGKPKAKRKR